MKKTRSDIRFQIIDQYGENHGNFTSCERAEKKLSSLKGGHRDATGQYVCSAKHYNTKIIQIA